jgi:hypothetical protein
MSTRIDFDKSISNERLSFKYNVEGFIDSLYNYLFALTFPILFIMGLSDEGYDSPPSIVLTVLAGLISFWIIIGLILMNKLVEIKGINQDTNRRRIVELLSKEFPNQHFDNSGGRIIISRKSAGSVSWGKTITLLFKGDTIYINILTIGRWEIKSPYHAVTNLIRCRKIARQFLYS